MSATLVLGIWLVLSAQIPELLPEDPFAITDEMRQFVDSHIDRGSNRLQQLHDLVRVVFQENALKFTYVPETRTASETFTKRGGNCVSFTFLFIAMSRYLGFDARFREVDIVPTWSQVGNITSISGHANAAVFIGAQGYVVDLYPQVNAIQLGGRVVSDARANAHFFSNRGVNLLGEGEHARAMVYLNRAIESDPTMTSAWLNKGVAHSFLGQDSEAEKCYLRATQLDAGALAAMNNLSILYFRMGRKAEAKSYETKVRKFNQKNPYYHYNLGMQAFEAKDFRLSAERLRAALKLKPKEHHFSLALARAYAQMGILDKAAESLREAARNAPDNESRLLYSEKLAYLSSHQRRT
jgi:Flp pilus assembly protein TadD